MLNLQNFENFGRDLATTMPTLRFIDGVYRFNNGEKFEANVVADVCTLSFGWVRWDSGFPVKRIMGRVADGFQPPNREELGDTDDMLWGRGNDGKPVDPWRHTFEIFVFDPTNTDWCFTLVINPLMEDDPDGRESLGILAQVYAAHARSAPDELPLIELGRELFPFARGSITYLPQLNVVGWWSAEKERKAAQEKWEAERKAVATDKKKKRRSK